MIECKLSAAHDIAHSNAPAEAAKYKDSYNGTCCALVAPAFAGQVTFVSELMQHGVSAWSTADLIQMLETGVSAYDLRPLFAQPGIAANGIEDLLWDRAHGQTKRLRVVASLVLDALGAEQRLAQQLPSGDMPHFTIDVAMAAVETQLADRGSSRGCTRDEVCSVFEWLTNPLVRMAVWTDAERTAIVRI